MEDETSNGSGPMAPLDARRRLIDLIEPVVEADGYELLDLELAGEGGRRVVRLFIDVKAETSSGATVGIDDCSKVSRVVGDVLEMSDSIAERYTLEVSSPGVERPLRKASHFDRFVGAEVKIRMRGATSGRRQVRGRIESRSGEEVHIRDGDAVVVVALDNIARARIVPDWDAVMSQGNS